MKIDVFALEIRKFQDLLFKYVDDGYDEDEKTEIKKEIIRFC